MKTCDVCRAQYSEQEGICPVCGYEPTALYIGSADDWKNEAERYRTQLLAGLSTQLGVYAHHASGDTLEPEPRTIPLTEAGALQPDGNTHWTQQFFCAEPDAGRLDVVLHVLRADRPTVTKRVAIAAPREHALLQLGISLEPDSLVARLALKNSTGSTASDPFVLLAE